MQFTALQYLGGAVHCGAIFANIASKRLDDRQRISTSGAFGHIWGFWVCTYTCTYTCTSSLARIMTLEAVGTAGLTSARRRGRAALRGISRALALQHGYMLAQIAEEIHAPDRAAQGTGERWV